MKKTQNTPTVQNAPEQTAKKAVQTIKVGLDVHKNKYVAAVMYKGQTVKRPRTFKTQDTLVEFLEELKKEAADVYTCYEAGPLGYTLHRALERSGIYNFVIAPIRLNSSVQQVKCDNRDSAELTALLDRYVAGNTRVLSVVPVPTEEQELARAESREREYMLDERRGHVAHISGRCCNFGITLAQGWHVNAKRCKEARAQLPQRLRELLGQVFDRIEELTRLLKEADAKLEASVKEELPAYLGKLTQTILDREIRDWDRFKTAEQIGSYTGTCPSVNSSGTRTYSGSITKRGNARVRHVLIEAAQRFMLKQRGYHAVKKWKGDWVMSASGRRKKLIVALARTIAVDMWKVATGRTTWSALGASFSKETPI